LITAGPIRVNMDGSRQLRPDIVVVITSSAVAE